MRAALLAALLFAGALACLVLTPPFQAPDGGTHFFRAFQLSRGQLFGEKRGPTAGGELPEAAADDVARFDDLPFHPERSLTRTAFQARVQLSARLTPEALARTRFVSFPNTILYSPLPYIPQALGLALASRLHLRDLGAFYLASLFALLASMLCLFLALRALSFSFRAQSIVFVVAGLPTSLFLMGSLSADGPTIALSILAVALALRIHNLRIINNGRVFEGAFTGAFVGFLVTTLLLSGCKTIYFLVPLAMLPCVLRAPVLSRETIARAGLVLATALLPTLAWSALSRGLYTPMNPGVDPPVQLQHLLAHPAAAVQLFGASLLAHARFTLETFLGVMGWLDARVSRGTMNTCLGLLLLVPLAASDDERSARSSAVSSLWLALVALAFLLALCVSQYLTWNAVDAPFTALQGRYFLPFAFPLLCLLPRLVWLRARARLLFTTALIATWSTVAVRMALALSHRYWGAGV